MTIGILALQGAVQDHGKPLTRLGAAWTEVRYPADLEGLDGLILPGGESTVMARYIAMYGLAEPLRAFAAAGRPVWGLCAGAILLCAEVDGRPGALGLIDLKARRNAYGRQLSSFEEDLVTRWGSYPGIFIRAPRLEAPGPGVEVLATRTSGEGEGVFFRQGKVLAASFHPELSGDDRLHAHFLALAAGETAIPLPR